MCIFSVLLTFTVRVAVVGPGKSIASLVDTLPRVPPDIVDEESRFALFRGSIGIESESEWVAQSDDDGRERNSKE